MKTYLSQLDGLFGLAEVVSDPDLPKWLIEDLDHLATLRAILMDPHPPQALIVDGTLKRFQTLARDLESRISMFDVMKMDRNMAHQMIVALVPVLKVTSCMWEHARSIFEEWQKPSREYYPRTGRHGYIDYLIEYLKQVVLVKAKADDDSIGPMKLYILRLQPMLQWMSGRLLEIQQQRKEYVDLKNLMEEIANLAYDTEYAIDFSRVKDIPVWYGVFWLQDIQKELKEKIGKLKAEFGDVLAIMIVILEPFPLELKIIATLNNTEISEKLNEILKATERYFQICTWSLVSDYKEKQKEVLLQLIHNASFNAPYTSDLSEDEIKKLVQVLLQDKQYFIILKDVYDIEDFDAIRRVLPDDGPGNSRVLLTTNSSQLVAHVSASHSQHGPGNSRVLLTMNSAQLVPDVSISQHSPGNSTTDSPQLVAHDSTSQHTKQTINDDVFGFETETKKMLDVLLGEPKQQCIIAMVGSAGQGKTTLAKKLYDDLSVTKHFYIQAWVCVSEIYWKRELIMELLRQVSEVLLSDTIDLKNDEQLVEMLCQRLSKQRYLIVLDDVRSTEAWDDLKRCFPDQNNGSRIIFTTRQERLSFEAHYQSIIQFINPLSDDESWALLQKKLFQKEPCPDELIEVGRDIAKHCKGLPLSIVLVSGLLANMENRKDMWKEIAENLTSHIFYDPKVEDNSVIELCYEKLQDHLKPLFLYFASFQNRDVPVQKMIRLWISEGFIRCSDTKRLEDVAEAHLLDLIERSLVNVAQQKSITGVKSCRVHDLLHKFALTKSAEENFIQQIKGYDEQLDSYSKPITYYGHRLSINSKSNHFFHLKSAPIGPLARSLLLSPAGYMSPSNSYDISFIFRNFKLLKTLNLEGINIGDSFNKVDVLIRLRYLAVQGTMVSVPSSIDNLLNLETICVKSIDDETVKVPDSIWDITSLRHMHITGHPSFDMEPQRLENSSVLDNLQTLSTPSLAYGDNMEKLLKKLPGIRKLNCIFLDSLNDVTKFPMLEFLVKLESLKVFYNGEMRYPCEFNFPSKLKKLTLTNFYMPWSAISQLVKLCNLEVLKLLDNAFDGETWDMEEEEIFPKLKFLKLESLNVVQWIASEDNFPRLEHLLLHKCEQLKEIPSSIGDITTLLMIEVKWCSPSAAASALTIQEEQEDFRSEELKISIHYIVEDSESLCK